MDNNGPGGFLQRAEPDLIPPPRHGALLLTARIQGLIFPMAATFPILFPELKLLLHSYSFSIVYSIHRGQLSYLLVLRSGDPEVSYLDLHIIQRAKIQLGTVLG